MKIIIVTLSIILVILNLKSVTAAYNYYDMEAAWNIACDSTGESTIHIPKGEYFVPKSLKFSGKGCQSSKINFVINGTLKAPSDFRVLQNSKTWVLFEHVNGLTLSGGVFDAAGAKLWNCKRSGKEALPRGVEEKRYMKQKFTMSDGFVSDVVFQHLTMENARNPIIIDQKYCPNHKDCPGEPKTSLFGHKIEEYKVDSQEQASFFFWKCST
uniref:Uncharacterized protein n=1 Tax=Chenopodium quinoa TaxID=63459 RepID=A0A803MF01_CHEQI